MIDTDKIYRASLVYAQYKGYEDNQHDIDFGLDNYNKE